MLQLANCGDVPSMRRYLLAPFAFAGGTFPSSVSGSGDVISILVTTGEKVRARKHIDA